MMCLLSSAQGRSDAFVISAEMSVPAHNDKLMSDGSPYQLGSFKKYGITGAYEKFVWKSLFVMPKLSLWYSDNSGDKLIKHYIIGVDSRPDLKPGGCKSWQLGSTIAANIAYRIQLFPIASVDIHTGPKLDVCLIGRVENYGLKYDDFYRTVTFDWGFGATVNVLRHICVGVEFDIRPGHHKTVETGEKDIYWRPSGQIRRNVWTFSVGYRF